MKTLAIATKDGIITAIHILWERGWQVNAESVQEMLQRGCHNDSSLDRIESVIEEVALPETKEKWLKCFNWDSPWAKEQGFPWAIDQEKWKKQQIEQ